MIRKNNKTNKGRGSRTASEKGRAKPSGNTGAKKSSYKDKFSKGEESKSGGVRKSSFKAKPEFNKDKKWSEDKPERENRPERSRPSLRGDKRPSGRPSSTFKKTERSAPDDKRTGPKKPGFEKKSERSYSEYKKGRPQSDRKRSDSSDKEERPFSPKREYKKPYGDRPRTRSTEKSTYRERPAGRSKASSSKEKEEGIVRLNKYLANTGLCSRREADELITAGAVMVNGVIVTEMGYKVGPEDEVRYGGQTLRKERPVYVLLNKPKDFITTTSDPENRRTVMGLVADACRERIYPVGRLDRETTGLLLLTNDGEMTKKLTHPSSNIRKIYHVELDKNVRLQDLKQIAEGIELEDGMIQADEISYVGESKTEVGIEIHSGKNRIIRRIFEALGYQVKKLDRVYFAGLTKKDLPRGRWRLLTPLEINMLKMLTGKKA